MSIRNYIVEIVPTLNDSGFNDIIDIGMFGGVLRWATAYDSTQTSLNCSTGFLSDKWIGTMNKSATVANGGNYSVSGGGTINTIHTTNLFNWLRTYRVNIYNGIITIKESRDGGNTYNTIRTGIVSQNSDEIKGGEIPFSDISKSTPTTITKEIEDSGKFYPVNFGRLPQAKTVTIKESADIPSEVGNSGNVAVFSVDSTGIETDDTQSIVLSDPYLPPSDQSQWGDYWNTINTLLQANSLAVKQGNVTLPIGNIDINYPTVTAYFKSGNALTTENGGIILSGGNVDLFVSVVAFGVNTYDDYFEGERVTNDLYNYDGGDFVKLPLVRDAEEISGSAISIIDSDSTGFNVFPMTCEDATILPIINGSGVAIPNIGDLNNLTDCNNSTSLGYEADYNPQDWDLVGHIYNFNVEPVSGEIGDTVLGFNFGGRYIVDNAPRLPLSYFVTIYDKFGSNYEIGTDTTPIYTFDVTTYDFDNLPPVDVRPKWEKTDICDYLNSGNAKSWKVGDVAEDPRAGIDAVIDLGIIPDIVWKTGFTLEFRMSVKNTTGDFFESIAGDMYSIQLINKLGFKTDAVYTNVEGRKNEDGTPSRTLRDVYRHCLMLQNYNNRAIVEPVDGWGLAYPNVTDWSDIYSEQDLYNIENGEINFQIMNSANARTDKIKAEICRLNWCIGFTDRYGVERIKSMNDGLYNTDGVLITYGDLFKGKVPTRTDRKYSNVFTDATFNYSYNTATMATNKSVNVVANGGGYFDDESALLYKVYNVKNKTPQQLTDLKWINSYSGGVSPYIYDFFRWQGVRGGVAYKRYTTKIDLPYGFVIDNNLDIASSILLEVPNFTYYNGTPLTHSGIITGITIDIWSDTPNATITAEMVGEEVPQEQKTIYIETGTADKEIIETGTQNTEIVEG